MVASFLVGTASRADAAKVKNAEALPAQTFALTTRVDGAGVNRSALVSITVGDQT